MVGQLRRSHKTPNRSKFASTHEDTYRICISTPHYDFLLFVLGVGARLNPLAFAFLVKGKEGWTEIEKRSGRGGGGGRYRGQKGRQRTTDRQAGMSVQPLPLSLSLTPHFLCPAFIHQRLCLCFSFTPNVHCPQ